MGAIKNIETGYVEILNINHTIGRHDISDTCINEADISKRHAVIYWKSENWYIQDVSRNGTIIDNEFVHTNAQILTKDCKIKFGKNDSTVWILIDDSKPSSYLRSLKSDKVLNLTSNHALPDEEKPAVLFYYSAEGKWVADKDGDCIQLKHKEIYSFLGEDWEYIENDEIIEETIDYMRTIRDAYFLFTLSIDEEHINIKICTDYNTWDLGERAHHYLLLTLARKKLIDHQNQLPKMDQGWIQLEELMDDIEKENGKEVDVYHLNVMIYRLRKQLSSLEPFGHLFTNAVERRSGEIRFSYPQFRIMKDSECIGEIMNY